MIIEGNFRTYSYSALASYVPMNGYSRFLLLTTILTTILFLLSFHCSVIVESLVLTLEIKNITRWQSGLREVIDQRT